MAADLERLPKDVLIEMALDYELNDILNLCLTSNRLNSVLCDNDEFWRQKLERDYPDTYKYFIERLNIEYQYPDSVNYFPDKVRRNWKENYEKLNRLTNFDDRQPQIYQEMITVRLNNPVFFNPSGLSPSINDGWALRKDKINNNITYMYPATHNIISPRQIPAKGENHPTQCIKIEFTPEPIISLINWDNRIKTDNDLIPTYRYGKGTTYWYDVTYTFKYEYDNTSHSINVYYVAY